MFPPEYQNRIFIAQHGSWNRSKKSGYRVMMVTLKDNKVDKYEVFAEGWMENERAWGRPVDLLVMPDGSLLISDDQAGVVYRVTYAAPLAIAARAPGADLCGLSGLLQRLRDSHRTLPLAFWERAGLSDNRKAGASAPAL